MESERDRKIRERAYELWVQGGQASDSAERDWAQAEQEFGAGSESAMAEAGSTAPKKATRAKAGDANGTKVAAPKAAAPKAAAKPAAEKPAAAKRGTKADPKTASTQS